ncbi:MAG: hypothetical protein LQ346_007031 [Caloplaca aetnensis]|nr:MAG: hypothetical protein LQ346_007031 [Caloplaca aetnensis]
MFHPEKLPSAQDRFIEQTKRVVGVLDGALGRSKSGWLVGDKCTYVDLSFFTWDDQIGPIMAAVPGSGWSEDEFREFLSFFITVAWVETGDPGAETFFVYTADDDLWWIANWKKWHERMGERKAVKKVVEEKAKLLAEAQH